MADIRDAVRERLPTTEIRSKVHDALGSTLRIPQSGALELGTRLLRKGRWIIAETKTAGVLALVEVTDDGIGVGALVGPAATVRAAAPAALRAAWLANESGEADDDPEDAKGGAR